VDEQSYEYIVVGSGAGGGTVAARLAEYGHTVLLLEAGGDPKKLSGGDPPYPTENRLPDDYDVPCFHAFASENDAMKWDFFVRHYKDPALQRKDMKVVETPDGPRILYPRAGTLGGCTAHNAQITIYPHNKDWDDIAQLTGDRSWSAANMRKYFQRLENCHHRKIWRWIYNLTRINPTRHGFRGWLNTEKAIPPAAIEDEDLDDFLVKSLAACEKNLNSPFLERLKWAFLGKGDANDWRLVREDSTGIRYIPLATNNHVRNSPRERVLAMMEKRPQKLFLELDALAARVLFDDANKAIGVEYLKGTRLYRAAKDPSESGGTPMTARATREVILAGGVYNSPQLLMLSGIGPREHLEQYGIACRHDLPAVGTNLMDRYEVGVVNRMNFPEWWLLKGAKFHAGDPQYTAWKTRRDGAYITNGGVVALIKKSFDQRPLPDLFIFALLGKFYGYFPKYSKEFLPPNLNYLTWCILKAHTQNCAGSVRLKSPDPRDTPDIDFCYFQEGNDTGEQDLASVVEAVNFVRSVTAPLRAKGLIAEEELPGEHVQGDAAIADFVKYNAWGHHASCTCPIGQVVDKDFQVYGMRGLRIVDASVFPKIPGFFIVSSVYTIGEKAADVIHQAAGGRV
jgi:choline dehydrogenase-like flavoprotein